MLGIKVGLGQAQKLMKMLQEKDALDARYRYFRDSDFFYAPIKKKISFSKGKGLESSSDLSGAEYVEFDFPESSRKTGSDLKSLLKSCLNDDELRMLKRAYDSTGSIAILEIDDALRSKEKLIAKSLLKSNKSIKTILRKDAGHEGEFRTQKMKWLAGKKTKETIHIENGVKLKLNVETVFFSPRLSTERKRVADLVKPKENILVMFSGCAPYPCVISRNSDAGEIIGIEINPEGHKYGLENLKINKIKNVRLFNGDVRKILPEIKMKFDRILMPLPKSAEDFLDIALASSKKGTIIHFYNFLNESEFSRADEMVDAACNRNGKKWRKIALIKCGQQSPRVYRICLDFEVTGDKK